jgi:branched-chain amino acid transport system substrate-binding protein
MKKIVFLIIASLLVIGLVLPGCDGNGEPDFEQYITFGVAGPMDDRQGEHHWAGAEMARDEINDDGAGGIDVGGTIYGVDLVEIDTNEVSGTPAEGVNAMNAHIDEVDFVVGGFRTESVVAYKEVAMEAEKIFMNCGAATASLQYDVVEDYDTYKYWFKATPYNEIFLVKSLLKMMGTIGGIWKATIQGAGSAVEDDYELGGSDQMRVAIIAEQLTWANAMVTTAEYYLGTVMGHNVTITKRPSATATDITTELNDIAATKPHIIFTILSGPVGLTYSKQRAELDIPALSLGINVEGQSKGAWLATNQGCQYDIMLDTWAEDMAVTSKTVAWFDDFVDKVGDYPLYNAATYDAIFALKQAIEATDSLSAATLIPYIETHSYTGVGAKTAYYPQPANLVTADSGPPYYAEIYSFNETQITDIYDLDSYGWSWNVTQWYCASYAGAGPHITHDTVYGVGYQTGIGSQWQDGAKVGIWPVYLDDPSEAYWNTALTDQYGNWNFAYTGATAFVLPIAWLLE